VALMPNTNNFDVAKGIPLVNGGKFHLLLIYILFFKKITVKNLKAAFM